LELCVKSGIDTRAVLRVEDRPSSRKLRILAQHQQLARLDWEDTTACQAEIIREILELLAKGAAPDVIVLSDYAKGLLTPQFVSEVAEMAISAGIRLIVDPKRNDFSAYRGANIITPNLQELQIAVGLALKPDDAEAIVLAARSLVRNIEAQAMVVTRGDLGMVVVPADEPHSVISAWRRFVFDTTGAGDTVAALIGVSLAAGSTLI